MDNFLFSIRKYYRINVEILEIIKITFCNCIFSSHTYDGVVFYSKLFSYGRALRLHL